MPSVNKAISPFPCYSFPEPVCTYERFLNYFLFLWGQQRRTEYLLICFPKLYSEMDHFGFTDAPRLRNKVKHQHSLINFPHAAAGKVPAGLQALSNPDWLRTAMGTKTFEQTSGWLHFYSANVNSSHRGKYPPSHPPAMLWQICDSKLKLDSWS